MKVYVTFDPLLKNVVCVHQMPNIDCKHCKLIRNNRIETNEYLLKELEKEVMEVGVKTYDSPAILGYYSDEDEQRKLEHIASADEEDTQPEMQFFNRNTGKMQKLFGVLNKVYTVRYSNHEVGWKGEALYITIEAENEELAKDKAMQNIEFTKHIEMKYFKRKCLQAYQPKGNYVIGRVEYYEGDPRL